MENGLSNPVLGWCMGLRYLDAQAKVPDLDASTVIFQQDEWLPPLKPWFRGCPREKQHHPSKYLPILLQTTSWEKHEGVWACPCVARVARKDCLMYIADRSRCHNSLLANDISIAKMTLPMLIVLAVHTQPDMYLQAFFTWATESIAPIILPHPCLPRQFSSSRQTCNHMDLHTFTNGALIHISLLNHGLGLYLPLLSLELKDR